MSATKHDKGKPRLDLLSSKAKRGLALVLGFGGGEYGDHNWRDGLEWSRLIAAAYRHLDAFNDGEDLDPKSGLPHIDHAQACLHFLSHYFHAREGTDDRYRAEPHVTTEENNLPDKDRPAIERESHLRRIISGL